MRGIPYTKMTDFGTYVVFKSAAGDFEKRYSKISEKGCYCQEDKYYYSISNTQDRREVVKNYMKRNYTVSQVRNEFLRYLEINYYYND